MRIEINPFASKFVSPSTCRFVEDENAKHHLEAMVFALNLKRCVQIVGPHGAGKTTLAVMAAKRLMDRFDLIRIMTIRRSAKRRLEPLTVTSEILLQNRSDQQTPAELVILDGVEQLAGLQRWLLLQAFLKRKTSLIVTCHRALSIIRYRITLRPSMEQFRAITHSLLENVGFELSDDDIESAYRGSEGNYRTGLSMLYDRYTRLSRQQPPKLAGSAS